MHLLLWAGQIILAIKLITVTVTHGMRPEAAKLERGQVAFRRTCPPAADRRLRLLALLAAVSLVLPPRLACPAP